MADHKEPFSWRKRARAFAYAWRGFKSLLRYEHNARIHVVAALLAIVAAVFFRISATEWLAVVICISAVISAEALNSAVEALADRITPEHDPYIGRAKDLGAAAVTVVAIGAAVVGAIIFVPRLINLL